MVSDGEGKAGLVEQIAKASGKSNAEVAALVKEKKRKFSCLLTESSAAFMVARELGVNLEGSSVGGEEIELSQLEEGMHSLNIVVRAMHIFSTKRFEKGERKGRLRNILVADSSGEMMLTLWNKNADDIDEELIERGDVLLLKNCGVSSFNGKKKLNTGYNSQLIKNPPTAKKLPCAEKRAFRINELENDLQNIDLVARVVRIYEEKQFERHGRDGWVVNFLIADDNASVRATAWDEVAESVKKLERGDIIKIEGAYTKEGLRGIELHLGWQARLLKNPKNHDLRSIGALSRKNLNEIAEGDACEVKATIVELYPGRLYYPACPKCGKKPEAVGQRYVCSACGELDEPEKRMLAAVELDDGTAAMRCSFFGSAAEKLLSLNSKELIGRLEKEPAEEIMDSIKRGLLGREILLEVSAKKNKRSAALELVAGRIAELDTKAESEKLLSEL